MSPSLAPAAQLLGRLLLAAIFLQTGLGKIADPAGTIGYITAGGLPLPQVAYWISVVVEFGGGLAILLGLATRPVAFIMAGFCLVTAVAFHYHPGDTANMINFMKNLAMAGGYLQLVAVGAGAWSVDAMFRPRLG